MQELRCLCLDVDGVLTDGRLFVDAAGQVTRAYHIHDGFAIQEFQRAGGSVLIVTGKSGDSILARARELGIEHVITDSHDKLADLTPLLKRLDVPMASLAAIGDDLPDLPVLRRCGFPIAVANAVDEVKSVARLVTRRRGGEGAVREAVEHLLAQRWTDVRRRFEAD
jgi:3-deoxy-D-manno-octulosonate 8-phosphate phosphatase (KDO 8-P phosphatase)